MYSEIRNYFESVPAFTESPFKLKDEDSLIGLGLVDSLGLIEVVEYLERIFEVEIEPADLTRSNFESIESIHSFIESKLSQRDCVD